MQDCIDIREHMCVCVSFSSNIMKAWNKKVSNSASKNTHTHTYMVGFCEWVLHRYTGNMRALVTDFENLNNMREIMAKP